MKLAQLYEKHLPEFLNAYSDNITADQRRAMAAIMRCQKPESGPRFSS